MRSRFVTGRMEKLTDAVLGYFVITLIYYGLSVPLIGWILSFGQGLVKTLLWWTLIIVGPFICGLLLGVATQREWLRWIAVSSACAWYTNTPTSWDGAVCQLCEAARSSW